MINTNQKKKKATKQAPLYVDVCYLCFLPAEAPSLTAQPPRKISADLDRNIDIPCQATGNALHTLFFFFFKPLTCPVWTVGSMDLGAYSQQLSVREAFSTQEATIDKTFSPLIIRHRYRASPLGFGNCGCAPRVDFSCPRLIIFLVLSCCHPLWVLGKLAAGPYSGSPAVVRPVETNGCVIGPDKSARSVRPDM